MTTHTLTRQVLSNWLAQPHSITYGGYTGLLYMADGELMHHACAKSNMHLILNAMADGIDKEWIPYAIDALWEGDSIPCCACNELIVPEYSDCED